MGSSAGWAASGVLGGSLALILFIVVVLDAGTSKGAAAQGLTGGLAPGAALNGSAVPERAWVPYIIEAGSMCQTVTAPIIAAQDQVESGWRPNAVSGTGAEGLAQFEPATWPAYDTPPAAAGPDSPFDPPDAILAQGRYDCALAAAVAGVAGTSGVSVLTLALPLAIEKPPSLTTFVPELASAWSVTPTAVTVHLRPGVRWQDGTPVTARDVLTGALLGGVDSSGPWADVDNVTMPNTSTIVFSLRKSTPEAAAEDVILSITPVPTPAYGRFVTPRLESELVDYFGLLSPASGMGPP